MHEDRQTGTTSGNILGPKIYCMKSCPVACFRARVACLYATGCEGPHGRRHRSDVLSVNVFCFLCTFFFLKRYVSFLNLFHFCFVLVWVALVSVPTAGARKRTSTQASRAPSTLAHKMLQYPQPTPDSPSPKRGQKALYKRVKEGSSAVAPEDTEALATNT